MLHDRFFSQIIIKIRCSGIFPILCALEHGFRFAQLTKKKIKHKFHWFMQHLSQHKLCDFIFQQTKFYILYRDNFCPLTMMSEFAVYACMSLGSNLVLNVIKKWDEIEMIRYDGRYSDKENQSVEIM